MRQFLLDKGYSPKNRGSYELLTVNVTASEEMGPLAR